MKILMTNRTMGTPGGSETWVLTTAREMKRNGHEVTIWTPGSYALIHTEFPKHTPGNSYDLGLINHMPVVKEGLLSTCDVVVHTRHGVIPGIEQPRDGADHYVAVSEESQRYNESIGYPTSVIRNGIDMERFEMRDTAPSEGLRRILILSNNAEREWQQRVMKAFPDANVNAIGRAFGHLEDVRSFMTSADLVITLGRGCYEAMAIGTPVLIADHKAADGLATPDSLLDFRKNNCSGRFSNHTPTVDWLRQELADYDPTIGPVMRVYVEKNNDVRKTAAEYLSLTYTG